MKFLGFFAVCLTAVSGFVAPTGPRLSAAVRPSTAATPMRMGLKEDVQKVANAASVAVLTAAPALATEGTGEPLGFENAQAVVVPLFFLVSINLLFNNWAKDQPEGDFFAEYDERR
ncbi:unnamed protein product [Ectocarpus sp. CCAP 1310/34]|nr:unnamed protein product [Ectocarpus sp. CCAP 1310/34]